MRKYKFHTHTCVWQSLSAAFLLCLSSFSFLFRSPSNVPRQEDIPQTQAQTQAKAKAKAQAQSKPSTVNVPLLLQGEVSDDFFSRYNPQRFQEAWFIADGANDQQSSDESSKIAPLNFYQDEHIQALINDKTYQPFDIVGREEKSSIVGNTLHHKVLTALRAVDHPLGIASHFNPVCLRYRFPDLSLFPKISVILTLYDDKPGLLVLTVHSLIGRTPPEILHEIILVDDNGKMNRHDHTNNAMDQHEIDSVCTLHPKIKCLVNDDTQGMVASRLRAIQEATGDVLIVMESARVEMYTGTWAQHLLLPILENPRTLAVMTLDTIYEDRPGYPRQQSGSNLNYGILDQTALPTWMAHRFTITGVSSERPTERVPYETPFAPWGVFAISRQEFWRLGGYDQGLAMLGGENIELMFKVWRCGYDGHGPPGRVVIVPCSRSGYAFRTEPLRIPEAIRQRYGIVSTPNNHNNSPAAYLFQRKPADDLTKLLVRNNMRILHVWGAGRKSTATLSFYNASFGVNSTNPADLPKEWQAWAVNLEKDSSIADQVLYQKRNKCKSLDWFDRHVYVKLLGIHHPWFASSKSDSSTLGLGDTHLPKKVSCGKHRAISCALCPQGNGAHWCNGECHWCLFGPEKEVSSPTTTIDTVPFAMRLQESTQCVPMSVRCNTNQW